MQNLWQFITNHFHWLLFLLLEAASLVMLFNYNSYQGSVWISSANVVAGKIYEWQSGVEQFFSLTDRYDAVSLHNAKLEMQNDWLRQRNHDLEEQLSMASRADNTTPAADDYSVLDSLSTYELVQAKVVSNTLVSSDNLITIDKGSADGVETDMGVVCGNGVVGVVYLTSAHYSVVLPALNKRSRISCAIRNRGYFGYLAWKGDDPTRAYVEDVPRHAKFKKGDWIETSGYSAIFPHGISVGRIEKIYNSPDGLSYRLLVHLSTDFARLRTVFVICDKGMAERMRLKEAALDSLKIGMSN